MAKKAGKSGASAAKQEAALSKAEQKRRAKLAEDATFGLKGAKKSKKVQQQIQQVRHQIAGPRSKAEEAAIKVREEQKEKRKLEKKQQQLAALLTRGALQQPPVPHGVDPKSVLCVRFKAGVCNKGDDCPYSHDLTIGHKSAKIDLYTDRRREKEDETCKDWTQEQLEDVIAKRETSKPGNQTDIVCRHFLEAVERGVYGWFWKCPGASDGKECKYKHALPPGFVLKKKVVESGIIVDDVNLEEEIERLRAEIVDGTPVTAETFAEWKRARMERKAAEKEARTAAAAAASKSAGRARTMGMSGRDLFTFDDSLFADADGAAGAEDLARAEDKAALEAEEAALMEEARLMAEEVMAAMGGDGDGDGDAAADAVEADATAEEEPTL